MNVACLKIIIAKSDINDEVLNIDIFKILNYELL